jgi:hypothetical protein
MMTDITDRLETYASVNDELGFHTEANCASDALKEIKTLRYILHLIGNDYYELSHEKVKAQRDYHMTLAKEALDISYRERDNDIS